MSWFRVESSLRTHPKIAKLARRLNVSRPTARGLVIGLWAWACDTAPDGNLTSYDAEDIAIASEWDGSAEALLDALIETRLLDRRDNETHLHDWMERAEGYKRAQKEADRRLSKKDDTTRGARVVHADGVRGARVPVTDGRTDGQDRDDREEGSKITVVRAREGEADWLHDLGSRWNSEVALERCVDVERYRSQWNGVEVHLRQRGIDVGTAVSVFVENAKSSGIICGTDGKKPHKWPLRQLLRIDRFMAVVNGEWSSKRGVTHQDALQSIIDAPLTGGGSGLRARAAALRAKREAESGPVIETTGVEIRRLEAGGEE